MYSEFDIGGINMTDAFIAFVRHEEELLLLRRSKSDSDSPGLWDGVYGIGDSEEDVLNRVAECTGIPSVSYTHLTLPTILLV